MKIQIIPSILEPDRESFLKRYRALSPYVKLVQLDVLDGSFLPLQNFHNPELIDELNPKLDFEVHLMIEPAIDKLKQWNYSWVKRIYFHAESTSAPNAIIDVIKSFDKEVGIAINPETDIKKIEEHINLIDGTLVMTVHPGKNGQEFLHHALDKVKELRNAYPKLDIEVDGGVNDKTAEACVKAGANLLIVGSYLKNSSIEEDLKIIENVVNNND